MSVSAISGSGILNFTQRMREFIQDPFGSTPKVKEGTSGHFTITNRKLQFFHKKGEKEPTKNHFVLEKSPGNKFAASVDVSVKFTGVTRNSVGMVLKKKDDDNYYAVEIGSDKKARFFEFKDGNRSVLKIKNLDEINPKFNLSANVDGPQMKIMIDGEEIFNVRDTTHSGGQLGFGGFDTPANFENLKVYR